MVTPLDLPEILRRRKGRFVLITFDDGYLDNYQTAFPILKRHRVPATFFVATGFVDNPRLSWWDEVAWMARTSPKSGIEAGRWLSGPVLFDDPDRESAVGVLLQAYKAMPSDSTDEFLGYLADATGSGRFDEGVNGHWWMTWDMLREMRAAGMVIGGHTVNHPVLAQLPVERQCAEIEGCGRRLAEELGEPMRHFSYPVGERYSFTSATRACLQKAGVRYAFSYYGGTRRYRRWDDLDIRRIAVESYMDPDWLRAAVKLPGIFGKAR
ncbi:MAG: polysaccharide deacetylase family protein [Acidobacteria bacterium]|nr:polysaccharide deacetylase family protein [Acidobacteriota bacterium]